MKSRVFSLTLFLFLLLMLAQPVAAHDGPHGTFLPGWVAWLVLTVALGLAVAVSAYVRRNGRL
jgi:hypothetical protein